MILVDTSIWIDHLHRADPRLTALLEQDECAVHEDVIEELALGSIARRQAVLSLLGNLHRLPRLTHEELLTLVERHGLQSRGLSAVDVHLLGSVLISPGAALWTRDKRLLVACQDVGAATFPE
ncbi:MAG: VapC toxin family PIN domain ribonuclease [Microbacterium sp. 14-71-5]|jgi:predicted nucleic acid-binding protein|uniref:type II toxin-antitoxin system VapC family toxin n=1 Tax=Microbacterium sp. 13-71-7 TaxID=1970399 RepID=UPI000BCCB2BD|nr:type II toxin-antitoxin system VapC family toxin [Microbacterium sp. 13-71-7]OZB79802.1 MAG: VapC toxin family PIN domain ribonuclease [Microbacterium sp. 13-71-7]OZB81287.1 MAG: VapC toxin family PIN domain ribonuclease [Microbacterium sp. 14-71-5]